MQRSDHDSADEVPREQLERRIAKLEKINTALMNRVERSLDQQANAYSMFQTAIGLESQVRIRTEELKSALDNLETLNQQLTFARDTSERASKVKTRFFTAVSHDVLQPLHAARLSLSALIDGVTASGHRDLAEQVDHALSSIEELLRTMLDISKLEAGVIKPSLEPIGLKPLFQSLLVDLKPLVDAKGLTLACRSRDLGVRSDPLMLKRILQNLLANALHYTRRGGILVAARPRGNSVRIEVWDTGSGIPLTEQDRIFEEFQRGASSAQANRGGFGLGLSIVNRMAQTLDHRIELCSRLGHGTRFSMIAPRAATPLPPVMKPAGAMPTANSIGLGATRVLVIDNDPSVVTAMQSLLARWSCEVRAVRDLDEVESLIRQATFVPEIVLADFHLDHGEIGTDAIARLRSAYRSSLPAIVITADHAPELASELARQGCEVLRKPVRPAELRALMMHLLG